MKNEFKIEVATPLHLKALIGNLREVDYKEVALSSDRSADCALLDGFCLSRKCWTASYGEPFCMFGVRDFVEDRGIVWLLATERIKEIKISVLKNSKVFVDEMAKYYKLIENWVYSENSISIEWLKWCGFEIEEAKPYGKNNALFHHFYMKGGKNV